MGIQWTFLSAESRPNFVEVIQERAQEERKKCGDFEVFGVSVF